MDTITNHQVVFKGDALIGAPRYLVIIFLTCVLNVLDMPFAYEVCLLFHF